MIPTKPGGLGELLANAPLLLERLATLTERLTMLMSDKNQASIEGILANTNRMTADLAQATPQVQRTLAELQITLRDASKARCRGSRRSPARPTACSTTKGRASPRRCARR